MAVPTKLEDLVSAARARADGAPPGSADLDLLRTLADAAGEHLAAAGPPEDDRLAAEVRRLALVDDLTGFHTRRAFLHLADYGRGLARRFGAKCGLVYARLDTKSPSSAPPPDELVLFAARVLRQTLREVDLIGRVAPGEFAVFGLTGEGSTAGLIARLKDAIEWANKNTKPAVPLALAVGSIDLYSSSHVGLETLLAEAQRASHRPDPPRTAPA